MNTYAIYSTATGQILRMVRCHGNQALDQLSPGEALLPALNGERDDTHHVQGGQLVPLPPPPPPAPPPPPTEQELRQRLVGWAQAHLDAYARSWGYDDIRSACTYVGDPHARFNAEGVALRNWRSAVWAYLDARASEPLPDPLPSREEFMALLPEAPARPVA